ncbi:MAG: hypothetical protein H0T46_01030 [Deltaproteobacteria bacterium]|nr:hypothetical protein [Deltaproteobacteria bacterium]
MFCSLDKIDLAADVEGRVVAVQTDHRGPEEAAAAPEISALFAMTRVINARAHLAEEGRPDADVRYAMPGEAPPILREALAATGALLEKGTGGEIEAMGPASEEAAGALADRCFAALARKAAAKVGVRDLGMALRMLEDQTVAAPPLRETDEAEYWSRVLELGALVGELLRAKHPEVGRWIQSDRALVPFGFRIATGEGATVMFPTNRAQRLVEDGREESLFKLLVAAEEALETPPDANSGKFMPSLRGRDTVDLDEVVWRSLVPEEASTLLPIVVCGVDGESTFGMIRGDAMQRPLEDAFEEALANLADERVNQEELHAGGMIVLVVNGSFYAAEKVLDVPFMQGLHDELRAETLAVATPTRGMLLVTNGDDPRMFARFAALARLRYDDSGARSISPAVMLVTDGVVSGYVRETAEP